MLLRKLERTPERMTPIAMMLIAVGLGALIAAIAWPRHPSPPVHTGADWDSFLHGFLMGLAIALEAGGVVLAVVAAKAKAARRL
jgi:hypothetical protein